MARKHRLDQELVDQGLFPNVEEALRSVLAGEVSTTDRRLTSPGEQVPPGIELHVRGRIPYVSRGGFKLERALEEFEVDVRGTTCLDVGCSTGGFTDCLLRHGAARVVAVDVGRAQFDWSLRQDARVALYERTNVVDLPELIDDRFDLAVCDVSFTSVTTILPAVVAMLAPGGMFVTLVKPQFEAPRADVGEGGIVRSDAVRAAAIEKVRTAFEAAGFRVLGVCESPITGHKGNVEYLLAGVLEPS